MPCESVIDFMKKLILHVPDDQFKMIRYYGVYASVKKKTRALVKVMTQRLFHASLFKKIGEIFSYILFIMILYYVSVDITWNFWNVVFPKRKTMLMETEYMKMKCKWCGDEE